MRRVSRLWRGFWPARVGCLLAGIVAYLYPPMATGLAVRRDSVIHSVFSPCGRYGEFLFPPPVARGSIAGLGV